MQGKTVVTVTRRIAALVATVATTLAAGQNGVNVGRIDPARIATHGFGASGPVAPNDTEEGRSMNRRVEFKIESVTPQ